MTEDAVPQLRVVSADTEGRLRDWRHVHNIVIPTHPLSADDVAERASRNRLEVAYADGVLVGCSTVRPPTDLEPVTVIVRVLPGLRLRGFGTQLYAHCLAEARSSGPGPVQTVVLGTNEDGLAFARRRGFVEVDRYVLDGDTVPYVELRHD